jgi:hypothetical protein
MQANKYLTLSKAIPYYFKMLEKLVVIKIKGSNIIIKNVANIAYLALNKYYNKTRNLLALYIITICDFKYKIRVLSGFKRIRAMQALQLRELEGILRLYITNIRRGPIIFMLLRFKKKLII